MATYINNITTLAENAADADTNFNTAMYQLDALAQMSVISILDVNPASPSDGDIYLVDYTPAAQEWNGKGDNIAYYINSTDPEVRAEWIFVAPKKGMQVFLESDDAWLIYKEGTAGIGGGGWHYQYASEISGHILEPHEGSSADAHTFNLCLNPSQTVSDTSVFKTFEVTAFHATFRTQTSPTILPAQHVQMFKAKAILEINGSGDSSTRISDTDFFENMGGGPAPYRPYKLVSKTGLNILIEPGDTLDLKVYDMEDNGIGEPVNLGFSVHIREVQT